MKSDTPGRPKRSRPIGRPNRSNGRIREILRAHILGGKTFEQIAAEMEITPQAIRDLRSRCRAVWQGVEKALTEQVVAWVREAAGTDRVTEDPDRYLSLASQADKWCEATGQPLFPTPEAPTLCSFYRSYYLPVCLGEAAASSKQYCEIVLRRWRLVTGDPPIASITPELLAKFKESLSKSRGLRTTERMRPRTIKGMLSMVQSFLNKAGPPGPRNRDGAGIIDHVPWVRPPRFDLPMPETIPLERIEAVYLAAAGMETPRLLAVRPPKWWKALIAVAYNTGLRIGTLFALRWEWIDWQARLLTIPGGSMKMRRAHVEPLNDTALRHLRSIEHHGRELVFPWPGHKRHFFEVWHALLTLAGIPRSEHFGLHALRRTHGTLLFGANPAAARLSLGHTNIGVTIAHYIAATGIVAEAVNRLPQPAAFAARPAGEAGEKGGATDKLNA